MAKTSPLPVPVAASTIAVAQARTAAPGHRRCTDCPGPDLADRRHAGQLFRGGGLPVVVRSYPMDGDAPAMTRRHSRTAAHPRR